MQKPATEYAELRTEFAGVLNPSESARAYSLRRFLPSAALAPFVEHYWLVSWQLPDGETFEAEVLPHPNLNLAFQAERAWITGVTTGKYTYAVRGTGGVFGVMFRPGGFRPFFGRPAGELMDGTLEASAVFPRATLEARGAIAEESELQMRIGLVEAVIMGDGLPAVDPNIETAAGIVALAAADRTIVTVASLAKRVGMNDRTLQNIFRTYVGVGPKWVIRLYRLVEAAARATADSSPNWTAVAHELGYTDQAHFTNDFRQVVGRAPTDYARQQRG